MKNISLIIIIIGIVSFSSCEKVDVERVVKIKTGKTFHITTSTTEIEGEFIDKGSSQISEWGICYNTLANPDISSSKITQTTLPDGDKFNIIIDNLSPGSNYHARTYAIDENGIVYGNETVFVTLRDNESPVNITSPANTNTWLIGNNYEIKWNSAIQGNVKIELFKNGIKTDNQGILVSSTPNENASFNWSINEALELGADYTIKITSLTNPNMTGESQKFTISDKNIVFDIDGNYYETVTIGKQVWMAENIKATRYSDGTEIKYIEDNTEWSTLRTLMLDKAYCYYNNNANNEADLYGALYTWTAASRGEGKVVNPEQVQGICPTGWHLPSNDEWKELEMYLGMSQEEADAESFRGLDQGGKLKEAGTELWQSPNYGASNSSGFTARPGGYRGKSTGEFQEISTGAYFWSATNFTDLSAIARQLYTTTSKVHFDYNSITHGFSVRCIKD